MNVDPPNPFTSRESTIRRDREGRWFHEGVEVENASVAAAFDRWVDVADDGRFILRNQVNWVYVEIEGAPIIVRDVRPDASGLELDLSDGSSERLDPSTLCQDGDGVLHTRARGGKLAARFSRHAQLALEPIVEEDEQGVYLDIAGKKIRPPVVADPLRISP